MVAVEVWVALADGWDQAGFDDLELWEGDLIGPLLLVRNRLLDVLLGYLPQFDRFIISCQYIEGLSLWSQPLDLVDLLLDVLGFQVIEFPRMRLQLR